MYVKRNAPASVSVRLDPLTKARIAWLKARFGTVRPSGSMLIRRALAYYVQRVESISADNLTQFEHEECLLRACGVGDAVPWRSPPEFAENPTKPFKDWVREAHKDNISRFLASDPFKGKAIRMGVKVDHA